MELRSAGNHIFTTSIYFFNVEKLLSIMTIFKIKSDQGGIQFVTYVRKWAICSSLAQLINLLTPYVENFC